MAPPASPEFGGKYESENKVSLVRCIDFNPALMGDSSTGCATVTPGLLWHGVDK